MEKYYFCSNNEQTLNHLESLKKNNCQVAIYSSGHIGRQIKELLESKHIAVSCFINGKFRVQSGFCDGIPILDDQTFTAKYPITTLVINCENHTDCFPFIKNKIIPWYELYYGKIFSYQDLLEIDPETWCLYKSNERLKQLNLNVNKLLSFFYINVCITQKCNLKCKYCSHLIPMFDKPIHYETRKILQSVKVFLEAVDYIHRLGILGGEPFLHPELSNIIMELLHLKKIGFIEILTNGTYLPSDTVLENLSNERILIRISDYGISPKKIQKFVSKLTEHKILYQVYKEHSWHDYGLTNIPYRRNEAQLKDIFQACSSSGCYQIKNGKLYHCAYSGSIEELGLKGYPKIPAINLLSGETINNMRFKIRHLMKLNYISICDYCNGDKGNFVRPGLQIKE